MAYSSKLIINMDKLKTNISEVRRLIGKGVKLCAVVKADAYGLGTAGIVPLFAESCIDLFGVARFCEAVELNRIMKKHSHCKDIFVMGLCGDDELEEALLEGIVITLDSLSQAEILSEAALRHGKKAAVHIKLDTGFGRLGLRIAAKEVGVKGKSSTWNQSLETYRKIFQMPGLEIKGTFSHLALVNNEEDEKQMTLFREFCADLKSQGINTGFHHICDSIGMVRYPDYRMDMVRPGAILYGMRPFHAPLARDLELELPVSWVSSITRISQLQEGEGIGYDYSWKAPKNGAVIATIPVGYADGFPRNLSRSGHVLVRGVLCPLAGLICMDQLMVDVSLVPSVKKGDEVVLLGKQSNDKGLVNEISILDLAESGGTNRNEILARIGRRVLRQYYYRGIKKAELGYLDEPAYREYN